MTEIIPTIEGVEKGNGDGCHYCHSSVTTGASRCDTTIYQAAALPFGGRIKVMGVAIKERSHLMRLGKRSLSCLLTVVFALLCLHPILPRANLCYQRHLQIHSRLHNALNLGRYLLPFLGRHFKHQFVMHLQQHLGLIRL